MPGFLISWGKIAAEEVLLSPELWHHATAAVLWPARQGPRRAAVGRVSAEGIFCHSSHRAPADKGKLQILEVCVCTIYGQVFTKTVKMHFLVEVVGDLLSNFKTLLTEI